MRYIILAIFFFCCHRSKIFCVMGGWIFIQFYRFYVCERVWYTGHAVWWYCSEMSIKVNHSDVSHRQTLISWFREAWNYSESSVIQDFAIGEIKSESNAGVLDIGRVWQAWNFFEPNLKRVFSVTLWRVLANDLIHTIAAQVLIPAAIKYMYCNSLLHFMHHNIFLATNSEKK